MRRATFLACLTLAACDGGGATPTPTPDAAEPAPDGGVDARPDAGGSAALQGDVSALSFATTLPATPAPAHVTITNTGDATAGGLTAFTSDAAFAIASTTCEAELI